MLRPIRVRQQRYPINALVHILSCPAVYALAQPKVNIGTILISDSMPNIPNHS